jgi:hypothetical protein
MEANTFRYQGDTIRFTKSGRMIDGQHRLIACVMTQRPFWAIIVTGLDEDVSRTIDTGKIRTLSNVLDLNEGQSTLNTNYASITQALMQYELQGLQGILTNNVTVTKDQLYSLFKEQESEIITATNYTRRATGVKLLTAKMEGFFYVLFHRADHVKAKEFFDGLNDGIGLTADSPVRNLRDRLINANAAKLKAHLLSNREIVGIVVKAWNAFMTNTPVKSLRFSTNESFPSIYGLPDVERVKNLVSSGDFRKQLRAVLKDMFDRISEEDLFQIAGSIHS